MNAKFWNRMTKLAAGVIAAVGLAGSALAQDPVESRLDRLEKQNEELRKQTEALLKQNETLMKQIGSGPEGPVFTAPALRPDDVREIVSGYLQEKEVLKAPVAPKTEQEGFVIGKAMGMTATWTGNQPWLETADKAFRVHFGGRFQPDLIIADAEQNVQTGTGGTGAFNNATNFRRARLEVDGWLWEVIDFFVEYDWINSANVNPGEAPSQANIISVPAPTDVWASINKIPVIGGIRVGN